MAEVLQLKCSVCEREYAPDAVPYTCPVCGDVGTLDVLYDYERLRGEIERDTPRSDRSMWRWRDLLPLKPETVVPPLRVGGTPMFRSQRLEADLCVGEAWLKDDGQNPTGSLKDRASALIVARAVEAGIDTVSTASTGNAAAALAGIGASVQSGKMRTIIFVPASAPEAKIAQLLVYGAEVVLVEGTYDQAFDLCKAICIEHGWYCRNTGMNPYTVEGKKTVAYEIAESLGWNVPDVVAVGVGDGNIIAGVYKGFYDLLRLGWIERIPRLIGVQALGSSPLVQAWEQGLRAVDMQPVEVETLADSIAAGLPRDRSRALRSVRATDGALIAVPDADILAAIPALARLTGVFCEPSSAAVYAGVRRAVQLGIIRSDERVTLLLTGNGLKDIKRAQQAVSGGLRVAPNLDSVRRALQLEDS